MLRYKDQSNANVHLPNYDGKIPARSLRELVVFDTMTNGTLSAPNSGEITSTETHSS